MASEGNLEAEVERLLNVEKQMRLAGEVTGTKKAVADILKLCFEAKDWKSLNEHIVVLSKRRGQLKQTLSDFQYIDSSERDQGSNVRKKSQSIVALVNDKDRVIEVRQKAAANKDKQYRAKPTEILVKDLNVLSAWANHAERVLPRVQVHDRRRVRHSHSPAPILMTAKPPSLVSNRFVNSIFCGARGAPMFVM